MRYPLDFMLAQKRHRDRMRRAGVRRYPSVLMLEPLYTCNLACMGCAIERHTGKLSDRLSVAQCVAASDACDAPIVNLCGGEPTLYPELSELIEALMARDRYVILCTNALRLEKAVFDIIRPSRRLYVMVHLDGMRATHDKVCRRSGVFGIAVSAIREAKRRGYVVMINTTVYKETDVGEVEELCALGRSLRADGILISPGYEYDTATPGMFASIAETQRKFSHIKRLASRYKINATPAFLDFAAGLTELPCAPWSTVNYTPLGWRAPCYLVGERHYPEWKDFWSEVDWGYWESRADERCRGCMMHSGFEHSAVELASRSFAGRLGLAWWALSG